MKKLPIIGLLVGAIAALAIKKKKANQPEPAVELQGGSEEDPTPTA